MTAICTVSLPRLRQFLSAEDDIPSARPSAASLRPVKDSAVSNRSRVFTRLGRSLLSGSHAKICYRVLFERTFAPDGALPEIDTCKA